MRHLVLAFGLFTAYNLSAADSNNNPSREYEMQNFLESLQNEIRKQDQLVNNIKAQVERTDIVPDGSIVYQFENAYTMLNVKKTLYANFVGTPSIQSPIIQAKLLQIFRKDMVTPADLAELSELVKQERPKYASDRPAQAPTSTGPDVNTSINSSRSPVVPRRDVNSVSPNPNVNEPSVSPSAASPLPSNVSPYSIEARQQSVPVTPGQ